MEAKCREECKAMVIAFIIAVLPVPFIGLLTGAGLPHILLLLYLILMGIILGGTKTLLRCMGRRYYLIMLLSVIVLGYIYISQIYYPYIKQTYEKACKEAYQLGLERAERWFKVLDPYLSSCTPVTKLHGALYILLDNHLKKVIHSAV